MEQHLSLSVIGGDTRMAYAAKHFRLLGFRTRMSGTELFDDKEIKSLQADAGEALGSDVLVFGLPATKNGCSVWAPFAKQEIAFDTIYEYIRPGQTVFGGMLPPEVRALLERSGACVTDYYKDEGLTLYNALLTSEAIVGILIKELPCCIAGNAFAVVGYGRIGFYLSKLLKGLGAQVTVFARSELQRAKAALAGLNALPLTSLSSDPQDMSALINTVPSPVIGERELRLLDPACLLVEAASSPYGIDKDLALSMGFVYYPAAGLPGKYAPKSAGYAIADAVYRSIREVNDIGSA